MTKTEEKVDTGKWIMRHAIAQSGIFTVSIPCGAKVVYANSDTQSFLWFYTLGHSENFDDRRFFTTFNESAVPESARNANAVALRAIFEVSQGDTVGFLWEIVE